MALTPQEAYRRGLAVLDRWAYDHFHADFVDLEPAAQDEIVAALATDQADGFDEPGARAFFEMAAEHTVEGAFSDPQYGGNRDKIAVRALRSAHRMQGVGVDTDREGLASGISYVDADGQEHRQPAYIV